MAVNGQERTYTNLEHHATYVTEAQREEQLKAIRAFREMEDRPQSYFIVTYGCQMNAHDSEKLAGLLEEMGMSEAEDRTKADLVLFNTCCVRDNAERRALGNVTWLKELKKEIHKMAIVFLYDNTIQSRLEGVGTLSMNDAVELGCVGPMARASGLPVDYRMADDEGAYKELHFHPITETAGDCLARVKVRLGELEQSIDIITGCLENLPDGAIEAPVRGLPPVGEFFTRVEQPRGEALYYVKGNGTKNLERFRLRTPTNANLPALVKMLKGCELADVPNIILTIDPCISCCER